VSLLYRFEPLLALSGLKEVWVQNNKTDIVKTDENYQKAKELFRKLNKDNYTKEDGELIDSLLSGDENVKKFFNKETIRTLEAYKEELKKPTLHIDIPVHADCKVFMRQLIDVLKEQKTPVFEGGEGLKGMSWNETVKYWLKKYPVCRKEFLETDDSKKANVYAFIKEISDRAKENQSAL